MIEPDESDASDSDLMQRVQLGEADAFAPVVRRHLPAIRHRRARVGKGPRRIVNEIIDTRSSRPFVDRPHVGPAVGQCRIRRRRIRVEVAFETGVLEQGLPSESR